MIGPRSLWIAARARNAARRVLWIVALGALAATLCALALVLAPRAADRQLREQINALPPAPDSLPYSRAVESARARQASAARDTMAQPVATTQDTMVDSTLAAVSTMLAVPVPPATIVVRDSATLELLLRIRRARQVPLVDSYRALAATALLQADSGAKALLDSIDVIEREREARVALGGADARYAALTLRVSELGHALVRLAERRVTPNGARVDTTVSSRVADLLRRAADSTRRDTLSRRVIAEELALQAIRAQHTARDSMRAVLEGQLRPSIAGVAVLIASLIVGVVTGYGAVLTRELRRPTIGDAAEVERLTTASVLVHGRGTPSRPAEGSRWSERPNVPRIIDRTSDSYVLLHLALSGVGDMVGDVDVLAADHAIGAAVALGTAAAAAGESRTVLLVEGDGQTPPLADLLHVTTLHTTADAHAGWVTAAEAVHTVTLDRDARIDVLFAEALDVLRSSLGSSLESSLAARYDLRIFLVPYKRPSAATPHDVIVCARTGVTTLAWLSQVLSACNSRRQRVRAVVLWNRERPRP